ncbi:TNF receptor-associated factor 4 [Oopsacas minuta]|uniref:TNF receptor-associated factor 4 n=1 Tax=Oopsacas minuta TaxID=111878 RepID=A0AAV7JDQ9_9METZ|nr:TNF receptor-associated factor 4 [Oopsacas minuta]
MATKRVEGNTKQLVAEIGRDLCRVQGKVGEYRGYRKDILTEKLTHREIALLVCKRCKGIMRKACISTSGEQFCECCRNHEEVGNVYPRYEQISPNIHVRNTVNSLKCSCPLQKRGCEWLGTLAECENHLHLCSHVHEKCKLGCDIVLPCHELSIHIREECTFREISCEHCKKGFRVCDMSNHLKKCPKIRMTCEQKCGTVMCREDMAQHLKKDCGRVVEKCKLGCGIELPRDELDIHVNTMCVQRKIPCRHCQKDSKACAMPNHLEECPKIRLTCELECGTVAYREDMAQHLEEECVEKKVECPFIKYKCEVGLIKRKKLNQHLKEKRTEHTELKLSAMEEIIMQQSNEVKLLTHTVQVLETEAGDLKRTLFTIARAAKVEWRIDSICYKLGSNHPTVKKQSQIDGYNFEIQFSCDADSIQILFLPKDGWGYFSLKWPFIAEFVARLVCHSNPKGTKDFKGEMIEVNKKDYQSSKLKREVVRFPKSEVKPDFVRDDEIELELFVFCK